MAECLEDTLNQHKSATRRREIERDSRAYMGVILICQPAHINTRKSTHLKTWEASLSYNSVLECRSVKNWPAHKFPFVILPTNAR